MARARNRVNKVPTTMMTNQELKLKFKELFEIEKYNRIEGYERLKKMRRNINENEEEDIGQNKKEQSNHNERNRTNEENSLMVRKCKHTRIKK